ncbi:monofunctional biosynthetic peptidoglycan transglycosylase [Biostraticola tofi]|uniref:Biosynthetic peptidoglycan transglycosylase n=1 Tax=Biostraticola tofi TaxID=466109 RepID=A0A4R3Z1C3_9GAMM|nr:monofunctional biosynthetic peptidoglycan transglycosylase [Biostraticola tofi]TCV98791.1 monofunctional biosynthetic peptidoglycan transglycosylase [Biostraticola tofi]
MSRRAGGKSLPARVVRGVAVFALCLTTCWLGLVMLFAWVPVPFSAVMAERQIGAWMRGDVAYVSHSDWVAMDQISPHMALAVIAAEDQRFASHWGFDLEAIQQALRHNETSNRVRGASTLSQQTAKNLLLWDGRSWLRKGLETGVTLAIETVWTKRRILTVYLNIAEFGPGTFGVEAAAQRYFHKPAARLTAAEAALLASVLPNPHSYRADRPSGYVLRRQQWILRQMRQMGSESFLVANGLR